LASIVLLGFVVYYLRFDLRSYSQLRHFVDPEASGPLRRLEPYEVGYWPRYVAHPGGMVVLHGIHHLGMDEPRLVQYMAAVLETAN